MRYIYTMSSDFAATAREWRDQMGSNFYRGAGNTKQYVLLRPGQGQLGRLQAGDSIYVNTHGVFALRGKGARAVPRATNQIVMPDGAHTKAPDVAAYLVADGLPNVAVRLKIWACFSAGSVEEQGKHDFDMLNTFAGQLCGALKATHPNVIVYGYKGETKALVFQGHKAAGLERPLDLTANPGSWQTRVGAATFATWQFRAKLNRVEFTVDAANDEVRWV